MSAKSIVFTGEMAEAIRRGEKTQTRRVVKSDFAIESFDGMFGMTRLASFKVGNGECGFVRLPYAPGDILKVREPFQYFWSSQDGDESWPADKIPTQAEIEEIREEDCRVSPPQLVFQGSERARKWFSDQPFRSGATMPARLARTTIRVTDVRVQRLQDISEADAIAEGCRPFFDRRNTEILKGPSGAEIEMWPLKGPLDAFRTLWDGINAARGHPWESNPWVAAFTFERVEA